MTDPFAMISLVPRMPSINSERNQGSWEKEIIPGLRPEYVQNEPEMSFLHQKSLSELVPTGQR